MLFFLFLFFSSCLGDLEQEFYGDGTENDDLEDSLLDLEVLEWRAKIKEPSVNFTYRLEMGAAFIETAIATEILAPVDSEEFVEATVTIMYDSSLVLFEDQQRYQARFNSITFRFGKVTPGRHVWDVIIANSTDHIVASDRRVFFVLGGFFPDRPVWNETTKKYEVDAETPAGIISWPLNGSEHSALTSSGIFIELALVNFFSDEMEILVFRNSEYVFSTREESFFVEVVAEGECAVAIQIVSKEGQLLGHADEIMVKILPDPQKYYKLSSLPHPPVRSKCPDGDCGGVKIGSHEDAVTKNVGGGVEVDVVRKDHIAFPELTICMITYAAPETLRHTLDHWRETGFISSVNQTIIFVQEVSYRDFFITKEDRERVQIIGVEWNIGIGRGMVAAVAAARTEYVIFMEDDWIMTPLRSSDWPLSIAAALSLLKSGSAQFVRFRDNNEFEGTPMTLNCTVENFLPSPKHCKHWCSCFWGTQAYVWGEEVLQMWMQHGVYKCHDSPEFLCFPAWMCPWSNNPLMYRREEFLEGVGVVAAADDLSWKHWLETAVNYEDGSFCDRNYTVAVATQGVFVHDPLGESEILIDGDRSFSVRV